jgi:ferredoxin/flavodoxin---NADP+ reductase
MDRYDVTIIGGGPTGLFAAFYAGLRGMKTKIIDALPHLGGQLTALYPEKYIYDVAGFPKVLSKDLAQNLIEQALQYQPAVHLGSKITDMRIIEDENPGAGRPDRYFELDTEDGDTHTTYAIVLTIGIGAFAPRKLNLEDSVRFEGKGVDYFVMDKSKFKNKRLLIVGGGDSAVDWGLHLHELADSVTLIHRRDRFRAHEESVKQLFESPVAIKIPYELRAIEGNSIVEKVTIYNNKTKEEEELEVDHILLNLGFVANIGKIKEWGLNIVKGDIEVTSKMETNVPGIYAAGDIVTYPGKLKLIATGFGEAATAINNAKTYIDPSAKAFPGHSSDMEPPPGSK